MNIRFNSRTWLAATLAIVLPSSITSNPCYAQSAGEKSTAIEPVKGMKIEVVGLQVSKPLPHVGEKRSGFVQMPQGSMFGTPGTEIHFFITDSTRAILDIDDEASKAKCTDDKGTDLSAEKEKSRFGFGSRAFSFRDARENGGTIIELHQPNMPAVGATKVKIDGELVLRCGIGEVVVEQKDVVLKPKTAVKAGPAEFVIKDARDEDFGDTKLTLEIESTKPLDVIKEMEFVDAEGKAIKHQRMGSASFGAFGKMTYQRTLALEQKADKVTLRIKHYKTIETVKVPLKLEVGPGF
jgi:hypothetical protein